MRTVTGAEWAKLQSPPPEKVDVMPKLRSKPGGWFHLKEHEIPELFPSLEVRPLRGAFVRYVERSEDKE